MCLHAIYLILLHQITFKKWDLKETLTIKFYTSALCYPFHTQILLLTIHALTDVKFLCTLQSATHVSHTHKHQRQWHHSRASTQAKVLEAVHPSHANIAHKFTLIKPCLQNFLSYTVNVHCTQDSLTHQQPVIFKMTYPRHTDIARVTYRGRTPFPSHVPKTLTTWSMFDRAV